MADKEVGDLTSATALDGSELLHVVQGGNSRQTTLTDIVGISHSQPWSSVTGTPTTLSGYGITDAQPKDDGLTSIAAISPTSKAVMIGNGTAWTSESGSTLRASLGVSIGSDVQAYDASLSALAGLSLSSGDIIYATGASTFATLNTGSDGQVLKLAAGAPTWTDASGLGDMLASTYDPTSKAADAFDMANMTEATDAKVMTAAERARIAGAVQTGISQASLEDADAVTQEGQYNVDPEWTGSPFPGADFRNQGYLLNYTHKTGGDNRYQAQIHIGMNIEDHFRFRVKDLGVWREWVELSSDKGAGFAPMGRLTLASGVPVMATSQAAATTVYYTPYGGNRVPIYDGSGFVSTAFSELSQATTDATKSPAAVAASKVYDLFVWSDSGTLRCTRGPAWTNSSTRGYTLTMVDGILLNTSSIPNGPAALRGTWVGTIASNASSTIDFIFGTFGPVAGVFNVWNAYNRVSVGCTVVDTGATYTYSSSTWRQARGSSAMQVSFVVGAAEDAVSATYQNVCQTVAASTSAHIGIGYDTTTTPSNNAAFQGIAASTLLISPNVPYIVNSPAPGTHFIAAMENSDGSNANTFNRGGSVSTSGLSVLLRM